MRRSKPNFQFYNQVSPRYVEYLFLKIEHDRWYRASELRSILRQNLDIEGSDIVLGNIDAWSMVGLGQSKLIKEGRSLTYIFQLTNLGKQVQETYSTNRDLFFDIVHFLFYSAWYRSNDAFRGRFWLYASVCNELWLNAPNKTDSFDLTAKLHTESQSLFPESEPAFPERSVRAVFPWLGALAPPFLEKGQSRSQLSSRRRAFCTPQLFHLATDLLYTTRSLRYGTSISVDDETVQSICKICLLDSDQFWEMADRTKISIRGFEIRKGQWGTSIALEGPPAWIELPELEKFIPQNNIGKGDEE
jgi:hypothetical protein